MANEQLKLRHGFRNFGQGYGADSGPYGDRGRAVPRPFVPVCDPDDGSETPTPVPVVGWEKQVRNALDKMGDLVLIRISLLQLEQKLASVESELESLKGVSSAISVMIQTFAPEPYAILKPMIAIVRRDGEEFSASFHDADLTAAGDTEAEAIQNLKVLVLDVFDSLSAKGEGKLGPILVRRLAALSQFIQKQS